MTTIELKDIYQGESSYPTFALKDNNGVAIDISTLDNIRVLFINDKNAEVLSKYSKEVETGFDSTDFVVISESGGTFGIRLQDSVTLEWCIGVVRIEVDIKQTVSGFTPTYKNILAERIYNVLPSKISRL